MHGLLILLEKSPKELKEWARDPTVSSGYKTRVLTVLGEDVSDTHADTLSAFVTAAQALDEQTLSRDASTAGFCERLFSVLLSDRERFLTASPEETRVSLRAVARNLIGATYPNASLRAALILEIVGHPEDAAFIEAHRPMDPTCAEVFDNAARTLLSLRRC